MIVELINNNKTISIVEASQIEIDQLNISFRRRIERWYSHPKVRKKQWDGYFEYFKNDQFMEAGLWGELLEVCATYGFSINKKAFAPLKDKRIQFDEMVSHIQEFFENKKFDVRDYQFDSVYKMLRYKRCLSEIATSAGKTFMTFCFFYYLRTKWEELGYDKPFKFLLIVPTVGLIHQGVEDFEEYNEGHIKYKCKMIYEETKNKNDLEGYDFVIGTFQSLVKIHPDNMKGFTVVMVDEAHKAKAASIKTIINNCSNAEYVVGISGTLGKENKTAEEYTLKSVVGPMVNKISANYLIENNYATRLDIKIMRLNYLSKDYREKLAKIRKSKTVDGGKILSLEVELAVKSKERLEFITNLIKKTTKNTLVLFKTIKLGYGKILYEHLRETCNNKDFYYVDGSTKNDNREYYKEMLETSEDKILIASFGTFATGISIKNIHNLFLVESYKSETLVKQALGRMMRQLEGKDKATVIDIVDDYRLDKRGTNTLYKHGLERLEIYKDEKHEYKIFNVKLVNKEDDKGMF